MFKKFFIIKYRKKRIRRVRKKPSNSLFLAHKFQSLRLVEVRLVHFNQFYNFKYNKITIRNQVSRWGSCSKRGNLSFNFRIALISPELADYIIVHEFCHLGEFNHSKAFWDLVEKTIPNWRKLRRELKMIKFSYK